MSRLGVQLIAVLLLLAAVPLVVSYVLVGQVMATSAALADGQAARLEASLASAREAYAALFAARKLALRERAARLAQALERATPSAERALERLLLPEPDLRLARLLDASGAEVARFLPGEQPAASEFRDFRVSAPLSGGTASAGPLTLEIVFVTPWRPFRDFEALSELAASAPHLKHIQQRLARYLRIAFLGLLAVWVLAMTGGGLLIARRATRRLAALERAASSVGQGDLSVRVDERGRDEVAALARAFNRMVGELGRNREQIAYLEKVSAWQQVARRLAHEIKNPLTPIQLALQQLQSKYQGGAGAAFEQTLATAGDVVGEEIASLRRLVEDFSAFAKLPSVVMERLDLGELVEDFVDSHGAFAQRGEVRIVRPAARVEVQADRMLLRRVLANLVDNALAAAEAAGRRPEVQLTITVVEAPGPSGAPTPPIARGRQVRLTVDDNGQGVPEELGDRVFDPYFTTKGSGTGLGLAIAKKIVLEHGGALGVERSAQGGARFAVVLP